MKKIFISLLIALLIGVPIVAVAYCNSNLRHGSMGISRKTPLTDGAISGDTRITRNDDTRFDRADNTRIIR